MKEMEAMTKDDKKEKGSLVVVAGSFVIAVAVGLFFAISNGNRTRFKTSLSTHQSNMTILEFLPR